MKTKLAKADQSRTMYTICSKAVLAVAATLLLTSGSPAVASWLDTAVAEKQCPATPVNVPGDVLAGSDPGTLLKQIAINGGTLQIGGTTGNPDHIVISAGAASGFVTIQWNGNQLGSFGPIEQIVIHDGAGDDVLIVKSDVHLPVVLDGGPGDDCLQSGSGGDQLLGGGGNDVLIAGTGRPALKVGPGSSRVVIPQPMGTLLYTSTAESGVLHLLDGIYDLQPLSTAAGNGTPSPIIVGPADLADEQTMSLLAQTFQAGQSIVLAKPTEADIARLRDLLGLPNMGKPAKRSKQAPAKEAMAPLVFFRKAPRPGTKAYDYRTGFFESLPNSLDDWTTTLVSQVFSATAIVPQAPGDSPSNDLQKLADSYTSSALNQGGIGSVQITNSVWDVRSFQNQADFYYVAQEVDYNLTWSFEDAFVVDSADSSIYYTFNQPPGLIQTSPASTQCSVSTTSGMSWNIGGSAGWNYQQTANATLTGGVSVNASQTISCPATTIVNDSNPATGETQWGYETFNPSYPNLSSYYNQWIWELPFSKYQQGQVQIDFTSQAEQLLVGNGSNVVTDLLSTVPMPFGDTFALQEPVVTSVNPACVNAGNNFTITGTGLYPSLVSSVLIDGTPLPTTQYTPVSDTQLRVVAPEQSGYYLPVVVQTGEGVSNSDVTIEISIFNLCPSN
jgi:hypothetical protein